MAATYTPIASITLGTNAASVTFNSIPATYTDLILIINGSNVTGDDSYGLRFNNNSSTDYSNTGIYGNGSSALSFRSSNQTKLDSGRSGTGNTTSVIHIMNYSNSTTWKTVISRGNNAASLTIQQVGLWRQLFAINQIDVSIFSNYTLSSGTTFNLYGILGANA